VDLGDCAGGLAGKPLLLLDASYAFIDRALYLPKAWTDDPDRCAAAGVPQDV
jgi:hypothetical protein